MRHSRRRKSTPSPVVSLSASRLWRAGRFARRIARSPMRECRKTVLEVLRRPMEDGVVTIARAAVSLSYPARFMLAAAMNPCPCGWHGDPHHACTCKVIHVQQYLARVSGPLMDRIDIHLE